MEIKLQKEVEARLVQSIQRYLDENFGQSGELKAQLLLKFCLEEIGPTVYNRAIADAQRYLQEKTADLENVCFAHEFGYWDKGGVARRPRR